MKVRVLVHLPKEQTEMAVILPEQCKSPMDQESFIAEAIRDKYPNYYRWGTVSWVIDWPRELIA